MKTKLRAVFLRQELFSKSTFVLLSLTTLLGAIVILFNSFGDTDFGASGIIATYTFMADVTLVYLGVSSLGKEFQYRTINMIRVSDMSAFEVLFRKLLDFVLISLIMASILLIEIAIYRNGLGHSEVDLAYYAKHLYMDFPTYAGIVFVFAVIVTLIIKSTLPSFLVVYFGLTGLSLVTVYLANFGDLMRKLMHYVPFSFVRGIFISGQVFYTGQQIGVTLLWTVALFILTLYIYHKRAFI